jgi:hypothetical protein
MRDDILGSLEKSNCGQDCLVGQIDYLGRIIHLTIDPDGTDLSLILPLARDIVREISKYDLTAREFAAKHLLEEYNEDWRKYQKEDEHGNMRDVINPVLSPEGFKERISLNAIGITGDSLWDLYYDDGGLFAGHSIIVTSFDGLAFSDIVATLFR